MGNALRLSLFSVCVLQATSAAACLRFSTLYSVNTAEPAALAERVPLNAPIVIGFDNVDAAQGSVTPAYNTPAVTLHAVGSDLIQSLSALELGTLDNKRTAFVSDVLLLPNTQYSVNVGEQFPSEQQAQPVTWTFTTGTEARAPLRLDGDLSVTLEAGTDPHYVCEPNNSLCDMPSTCHEMGTDHVTKARIQLPAAVDGFPEQDLRGVIQAAPDFDNRYGSAVARSPVPDLLSGQPAEILLTLPASTQGKAYVPCFTYTVSDARGDQATASLCADVPVPQPSDGPGATDDATGGATDDATGGAANTASPSQSHTSSSCSVSSSAGSTSSTGATLLGFAVLALLNRQRRSRSAP